MTPLLRKGATQFIVEDDIPSLRPEDDSAKLGDKLEKALSKRYFLPLPLPSHSYTQSSALWKALFVAYGSSYAVAGGLKILQDCLAFLQPQLLRWLLAYISKYQSARSEPETSSFRKPPVLEGFSIAALMFIAGTAQTVVLNQVCGIIQSGLVQTLTLSPVLPT